MKVIKQSSTQQKSHSLCSRMLFETGGWGGGQVTLLVVVSLSKTTSCFHSCRCSGRQSVMREWAETDAVVTETITFTCPCLESLNRERKRERGSESTPPLSSLIKHVQWIRLFHCHMSCIGRVSVTPAGVWATAPRQMVDVTARQTLRDKAAAGL